MQHHTGPKSAPVLGGDSGSSKLKPKSDGGAAEVVGVLPECNEECGRVDFFPKKFPIFLHTQKWKILTNRGWMNE